MVVKSGYGHTTHSKEGEMGVVWDGWLCLGTRYFPTLGSVGSTNHAVIVNIVILAESDDNGNYDH